MVQFENPPPILATLAGFVSFHPTNHEATRWAVTLLSYGPDDLGRPDAAEIIENHTEAVLDLVVVREDETRVVTVSIMDQVTRTTVVNTTWTLQSADGVVLSLKRKTMKEACDHVLTLSLLEWLATEAGPDVKLTGSPRNALLEGGAPPEL